MKRTFDPYRFFYEWAINAVSVYYFGWWVLIPLVLTSIRINGR